MSAVAAADQSSSEAAISTISLSDEGVCRPCEPARNYRVMSGAAEKAELDQNVEEASGAIIAFLEASHVPERSIAPFRELLTARRDARAARARGGDGLLHGVHGPRGAHQAAHGGLGQAVPAEYFAKKMAYRKYRLVEAEGNKADPEVLAKTLADRESLDADVAVANSKYAKLRAMDAQLLSVHLGKDPAVGKEMAKAVETPAPPPRKRCRRNDAHIRRAALSKPDP